MGPPDQSCVQWVKPFTSLLQVKIDQPVETISISLSSSNPNISWNQPMIFYSDHTSKHQELLLEHHDSHSSRRVVVVCDIETKFFKVLFVVVCEAETEKPRDQHGGDKGAPVLQDHVAK